MMTRALAFGIGAGIAHHDILAGGQEGCRPARANVATAHAGDLSGPDLVPVVS